MTAEVAILNAQAVALATDSAVTTGQRKVYTSANKLFTLSKVHPVGIMIFNSASFMGVPLETIIKVFRQQLGSSSCDDLMDYSERFQEFLVDKQNYLFNADNRETGLAQFFAQIAHGFFRVIRKERNDLFFTKANEAFKVGAKMPTLATVLSNLLITKISELETRPDIQNTSVQDFERVLAQHTDMLNHIIGRIFGKPEDDLFTGEDVTPKCRQKLCQLVILKAAKEWHNHNWSGIVIAGFGEKDTFPKLTSFYIGALVEDLDPKSDKLKLKLKKGPENKGDTAQIIPFAQTKEVYSFLLGIDEDYKRFVVQYWRRTFDNFVQAVSDQMTTHIGTQIGRGLEQDLRDHASQSLTELIQRLAELEAEISNPIRANLSNLPKDELATFAESLVSLVSLKRRASTQEESVGGPIDVAVISKGDGFVWIKRKHYFSPEHNLGFTRNYFREIDKTADTPVNIAPAGTGPPTATKP